MTHCCFRLVLCVIASLVASSCQSVYRDARLDIPNAPAPAVVLHEQPVMSGIVVSKVDGIQRPKGLIKRYELAPGEHTFSVVLNQIMVAGTINVVGSVNPPMLIHFPARAGQEYYLQASVRRDPSGPNTVTGVWSTWIEEKGTGKRFEGKRTSP